LALLLVLAGCAGVAPPGATDAPESNASTPIATDTVPSSTPAEGTLKVHYINVGQSAAILAVGPTGETLLMDTGHYQDDGVLVLQYLREQGIDRIDYLVVSHNDADHIGGNAAVIEYYETNADGIGAVYDPGIAASTQTYERYLDAVEEYDVTLYETREGDSIPFEGVDVDVLGPPDPYLDADTRNENGIVLKFTYGQTSYLLTGDAEEKQERYLVENYGTELQATVLKAGHHGSSSSTSPELLELVDPEVVIISSAYESQYGHPHEEVLQQLDDASLPAYWTATHGNIVAVSDGSGVSIRTQRAAPSDPLSLREGESISPGAAGAVQYRARFGGEPQATSTSIATDGGTETGSGALSVVGVNADAEGDDRENLNDEYVVFENTGTGVLDLSGWTVMDAAGASYTFPEGTTLAAGVELRLHTGSGTDSETDVYWGSGSPIWNNGGDTVIVTNAQGDTVLEDTYE
jgi:competence protein ComEC